MKRSKFSLSHYHMTAMNQGWLVPIAHFEVLPGDTVQMSTSALVRAAPLVAPVMHPVHARIHHWFVPYRLIWTNFEQFITGGPSGTDQTVPPQIAGIVNPAVSSLANYLGVPAGTYTSPLISALPFRAYDLIWNQNYRDEDLSSELVISKGDGLDTTSNTALQNCAWEKDYLTSARPFLQKGNAVPIPTRSVVANPFPTALVKNQSTGAPIVSATGLATGTSGQLVANPGGIGAIMDPNGTVGIDVNDLRFSAAVQRYMEARARFGSRYSEYLRYLGVKSADSRLQRPEYLGGGKQTIQFSEVLQTGPGSDPVGYMKGHGIGAMRSNRFRRFFEEHGIVMSLMSVKPRTVYMQGMHRSWFRAVKEDYWQRELEHLGQQTVYNREAYVVGGTPAGVFGYQDRYDDYRRMESRVSGDFGAGGSLKYWHMARDLAAPPVLNASFVMADPTTRVYAATSSSQLYVMAMHSIQCRRMLSSVSRPNMI